MSSNSGIYEWGLFFVIVFCWFDWCELLNYEKKNEKRMKKKLPIPVVPLMKGEIKEKEKENKGSKGEKHKKGGERKENRSQTSPSSTTERSAPCLRRRATILLSPCLVAT